MFFYCQSLGRLTERKPLCTPHLMDYPQAAGLGDRAEQEDRCRLFSWLKRRFDSRLTLMKRRPSYVFETSAPFTAFEYTQASAALCFAEPSRVQMWKKDARARVSLSWQALKVCWGEPERRWKCFGKKGNGGWKSTVAETMTTPIIPVIVVAERALYNIIQGGSDTPQQSRWWKSTRTRYIQDAADIHVTTETYGTRESEKKMSCGVRLYQVIFTRIPLCICFFPSVTTQLHSATRHVASERRLQQRVDDKKASSCWCLWTHQYQLVI